MCVQRCTTAREIQQNHPWTMAGRKDQITALLAGIILGVSITYLYIINVSTSNLNQAYFLTLRRKSGMGNSCTCHNAIASSNHDSSIRLPKDMMPRDSHIREKFEKLAGPNIPQDNPELIQFLKNDMIDPPRPFVSKISHPLYKTPQAEEVDKILKGKVGYQLFY